LETRYIRSVFGLGKIWRQELKMLRRPPRRFISVASAFAIASSGCALNSPAQLRQDLVDAGKQCSARTDWTSWTAIADCYNATEEQAIRQKVPAALDAYQRFSEKRRHLAEQADIINAKGMEQGAILRSKSAEAVAVLKAHEPKLADNNSTLSKEMTGANIRSVCPINSASERQICAGNIAKPIWERDAPDTIAYFDEFQRKQLEFARNFDASGALETRA
jgi:hypothetical protein